MAARDLGSRLAGTNGLLQRGQRQRVLRVLGRDAHADDFKTLLLELRFKSRGRKRFRDIADFVAHREIRDRGAIAELVRDIFVSARVFTMLACGQVPSEDEAQAAAKANLRLATDLEIAEQCAMTRRVAEASIDRAADMLRRGLYPGDRERFVFNSYGNRLKWHPAFVARVLIDEWIDVLRDNKLLLPDEEAPMRASAEQLILYVLTLLHGAEIELVNKDRVVLQAGFFNTERMLEVKAHLIFNDIGKPVFMPLCVFLTDLQPEGRCADVLLTSEPHGWDMPICLVDGQLKVDEQKLS